jgi:hypothetical protein
LELKLPSRQLLALMQVVFGSVKEIENMQVGRINLGASANFFAGQTHLRDLFRHFFRLKLQTGYFAGQGFTRVALRPFTMGVS